MNRDWELGASGLEVWDDMRKGDRSGCDRELVEAGECVEENNRGQGHPAL